MTMTFEATLQGYETQINRELEQAVATPNGALQKTVYSAMNYSLNAGGKRIRPVLTLEFCKAFGGNTKEAMPFALAVEMVHCYSLIHDDLPCMDDDDMRRGKPSCHKRFGEANALLAGDALLTAAFGQIARSNLSAETCVKAVETLSGCAGAAGMVGGQVIELENEGKPLSETLLTTIHSLKTSALIRAACQLGVLAGNGGYAYYEKAGLFANNLGLAFQILDDILDVEGDEAVLGKPIGSDLENEKTTFVTLYGLDKAQELAKNYTEQAKGLAREFPNHEFLLELTDYLSKRDH